MPILSIFLGIVVRIYFADHDPPHIHVEYGEFKALIAITNGTLMQGKLPKRVLALTEEWRVLHLAELETAWQKAKMMEAPGRIAPLED